MITRSPALSRRRVLLPVVQLYEASLDPNVHVIPRGDTNPEAARASGRVEDFLEQVVAVGPSGQIAIRRALHGRLCQS